WFQVSVGALPVGIVPGRRSLTQTRGYPDSNWRKVWLCDPCISWFCEIGLPAGLRAKDSGTYDSHPGRPRTIICGRLFMSTRNTYGRTAMNQIKSLKSPYETFEVLRTTDETRIA